ncbi:MAG: phosphate acyltransferase, partial [candidate division Zixibacteria bacterium]|nr:phosphate acyltransferase [candidate division Zixibacteria bacterium]
KGRVIMHVITDKAKKAPKKVVFPEGNSVRIMKAAQITHNQGIARPILLGSNDVLQKVAAEHDIDISGIAIIDPVSSERRQLYAEKYYEKRTRKGITADMANWIMRDRTYFGLMMLEMGDCDAFLSGVSSDYPTTIRPALECISLRKGVSRVSGLFAMIQKDKVYYFADTTVNINPSAEELAEIAISSANVARAFNVEPRIAMLSFSNFGSARYPESEKVARATAIVKQKAPDLVVEGEMQADTALLPEYMAKHFPFSRLKEEANVLIFPDLNSGNIAYKLAKILGGMTAVGPILMGLAKPVHVLHRTLDVAEIVDMAAIAVVDAQQMAR